MKRIHILERPVSVSDIKDLDFDDSALYGKPQKIERLQLRRWRQIKRQTV